MKVRSTLLRTVALLAAAAPLAHADTITFGSYGGSTATAGLSNTAILYDNTLATNAPNLAPISLLATTGTASAYTLSAYTTAAFSGTSFVSYDAGTAHGLDTAGFTTYTTTYTGNLAGYTGSLSFLGDDSVTAYLNGVLIGSTGSAAADTPFTFQISNGVYLNGLNTFKFVVQNKGIASSTGLDFKASATSLPQAVTPEPTSIVMLGSGLMVLAFFVRKRVVL